ALPGTHPDSLKDLDLYVVKVPVSGDATIQVLAADTSAGSDADLRPGLGTGDYYLAVVDFAGTTTTYELCVATITVLGAGPCAGTAFPSPALRARAGDQGTPPGCGAGRAGGAPLPAGSEDRRQARPPEHHSDLSGRERGWAQLLRDEVHLGHVARGTPGETAAPPVRLHPARAV